MGSVSPTPRSNFQPLANPDLQSYVELVFMNTANNLLYNKMQPLQQSMTLTSASLQELTVLENIHNLVAVVSPAPTPSVFGVNWTNGGADSYYAKPIQIKPNFPVSQASINAIESAFFGPVNGPQFTSNNTASLSTSTPPGPLSHQLWNWNLAYYSGYEVSNSGGAILVINSFQTPFPVSGLATVTQFETISDASGSANNTPYITTSLYRSALAKQRAQEFGTNSTLIAGFTGGFRSALNQLLQVKSTISTVLLPALRSTSPPSAFTDPNSLYSQMKKVLSSLNSANLTQNETPTFVLTSRKIHLSIYNYGDVNQPGPGVGHGLALGTGPVVSTITVYSGYYDYNSTNFGKWLIDGYNKTPSTGATTGGAGTVTAGSINQVITTAITSAQSLNTTQSMLVSSYLQTYQTYFQSAATILTQVNQLMEQIAQNITGR